jgi:hypothetical protein
VTPRDQVPGWNTVYPFARDAMRAFERGEQSLHGSVGGWRVLARAVPASSAACVGCHNNPLIGRAAHPVAVGKTVGGTLYLYR